MTKAISILLFAVALQAEVPSVTAIRNARVVTVSGPVLAKATVVVRDGLIEAVGENVTPPADAWVIEGDGLTVYPGLIDALSTWGWPDMAPPASAAGGRRGAGAPTTAAAPTASATPPAPPARGPEDRPQTTSWLMAADMVQPTDRRLDSARNAGFTTAVTFPTRGIFAGHGAVINLNGSKAGEMVVSGPAGLYVSMGGAVADFSEGGGSSRGFPASPMGVIAYIRQIYLDAAHYKLAKEMYAANPVGNKRPDYDRALEGVLLADRVLLPASSRVEINRMLRFAAELKLHPVLYGGFQSYEAAEEIKKSGSPMLVNLRWPERARDADPEMEESLRVLELRDRAPSSPGALSKAGVKFAFYTGGIDRPADIARAVKRAIDAGLAQADAVRALTLGPAEIFGVADRLGSIEKGKIANLVVTRGDLFQSATEVKYVFIDGKKLDPVPEATTAGAEVTQ